MNSKTRRRTAIIHAAARAMSRNQPKPDKGLDLRFINAQSDLIATNGRRDYNGGTGHDGSGKNTHFTYKGI